MFRKIADFFVDIYALDKEDDIWDEKNWIKANPYLASTEKGLETLSKNVDDIKKKSSNIITAAEQQTMNFYMNMAQTYKNHLGRKLFAEIGMVEEQHVTQYGSLMDTNVGWYENLLMHMYTMCYLYYSCMCDETNECIKKVWKAGYERSVAGLHLAAYLLREYDGKDAACIIPDGTFPKLLKLGPNIEYVREVFKLSEGEAGFLITCGRGEGLLKVGGDSAILAIQPTKKEFEFVETNLSKQAALEKARREAEGKQ